MQVGLIKMNFHLWHRSLIQCKAILFFRLFCYETCQWIWKQEDDGSQKTSSPLYQNTCLCQAEQISIITTRTGNLFQEFLKSGAERQAARAPGPCVLQLHLARSVGNLSPSGWRMKFGRRIWIRWKLIKSLSSVSMPWNAVAIERGFLPLPALLDLPLVSARFLFPLTAHPGRGRPTALIHGGGVSRSFAFLAIALKQEWQVTVWHCHTDKYKIMIIKLVPLPSMREALMKVLVSIYLFSGWRFPHLHSSLHCHSPCKGPACPWDWYRICSSAKTKINWFMVRCYFACSSA